MKSPSLGKLLQGWRTAFLVFFFSFFFTLGADFLTQYQARWWAGVFLAFCFCLLQILRSKGIRPFPVPWAFWVLGLFTVFEAFRFFAVKDLPVKSLPALGNWFFYLVFLGISYGTFTEKAPATFKVNFETSAGTFVVEVTRDWAPIGVDRFYTLVKAGFYDGSRFFRVLNGYIAVFGIYADPEINRAWRRARIPDEPRKQVNKRGYVAFNLQGALDSRTTLIMINLVDNPTFDRRDGSVPVSPFGRIVAGLDVIDKLYSEYGETAPTGKGPDLFRIYAEGNAYLEKEFPKLDYIKKASIVS